MGLLMGAIAVIGSEALKELGFDIKTRDLDLVASYDDLMVFLKNKKTFQKYPFADGKKFVAKLENLVIETELAWDNSSSANLLNLIINDEKSKVKTVDGIDMIYPSLNILYMLKMSHRYLKNSPHFVKTMNDIEMMRYYGAEIEDKHKSFYKERMKATYTYNHPNLNTKKNEFFRDLDIYVYDHDKIHEIVAIADKPAYKNYIIEGKDVLCSKELFDSLDEKTKLCGGLEETYVLALERSQIPNNYKVDPLKSFNIALEKVCTSITSGWFREFCWENYYKIKNLYDPNYVEKFKNAVDSKKIMPLNKL